jgi:hypothetical protein
MCEYALLLKLEKQSILLNPAGLTKAIIHHNNGLQVPNKLPTSSKPWLTTYIIINTLLVVDKN